MSDASLSQYTIEELREALSIKEEERLTELARKCHGTFFLTKDIVYVHHLLHSDVGEGFMDAGYFTEKLVRNTTHHKMGDRFALRHTADDGLHIFSILFDDLSYYESVGNADDIAFVLENSTFASYETAKP